MAKSDSGKVFAIADTGALGGVYYAMGDLHTLGLAMGPGGGVSSSGGLLMAVPLVGPASPMALSGMIVEENPYGGLTSVDYFASVPGWEKSWDAAGDVFAGEGGEWIGEVA